MRTALGLLVVCCLLLGALLFAVGERAVSSEPQETKFAELETVKTASFSGETCSRQGCVNRYYWWWKVSGKPESDFAKDYWLPCWLECVNGG